MGDITYLLGFFNPSESALASDGSIDVLREPGFAQTAAM
jgi:hypothetical protein